MSDIASHLWRSKLPIHPAVEHIVAILNDRAEATGFDQQARNWIKDRTETLFSRDQSPANQRSHIDCQVQAQGEFITHYFFPRK